MFLICLGCAPRPLEIGGTLYIGHASKSISDKAYFVSSSPEPPGCISYHVRIVPVSRLSLSFKIIVKVLPQTFSGTLKIVKMQKFIFLFERPLKIFSSETNDCNS